MDPLIPFDSFYISWNDSCDFFPFDAIIMGVNFVPCFQESIYVNCPQVFCESSMSHDKSKFGAVSSSGIKKYEILNGNLVFESSSEKN